MECVGTEVKEKGIIFIRGGSISPGISAIAYVPQGSEV